MRIFGIKAKDLKVTVINMFNNGEKWQDQEFKLKIKLLK